jgi:hypothetical protein
MCVKQGLGIALLVAVACGSACTMAIFFEHLVIQIDSDDDNQSLAFTPPDNTRRFRVADRWWEPPLARLP